jgi:hypothetical protein
MWGGTIPEGIGQLSKLRELNLMMIQRGKHGFAVR